MCSQFFIHVEISWIAGISTRPKVFYKKGVPRNIANFTAKHLCQSLFFNKVACNFIKKETLALVLSCESAKFLRALFLTEHLWTTASILSKHKAHYKHNFLEYVVQMKVLRHSIDSFIETIQMCLLSVLSNCARTQLP